MGCTFSSFFFCDSTAPTATEEASVSTTNGLSNSANDSTGGVVSDSFNFENEFYFHLFRPPEFDVT